MDFVHDQLAMGKKIRVLTVVDIAHADSAQVERLKQALRTQAERHARELDALLTERSDMLDVLVSIKDKYAAGAATDKPRMLGQADGDKQGPAPAPAEGAAAGKAGGKQ